MSFPLLATGFSIIQPNQAKVFTLFGNYLGVIKHEGFWFTVPLTIRKDVSLRVINFNSDKLKVNDLEGNPIEIAAVVVYRVFDSAKAVFDVEDYKEFVHTQSETGLRHIASQYRPPKRTCSRRSAALDAGGAESRVHDGQGAGEGHRQPEDGRGRPGGPAGQPLMAVIPLERRLGHRELQGDAAAATCARARRVTIEVDAYGGREFTGKVDSIAAATGARFSLLPPENATGNFVKVVQRVPVKIVLDAGPGSRAPAAARACR